MRDMNGDICYHERSYKTTDRLTGPCWSVGANSDIIRMDYVFNTVSQIILRSLADCMTSTPGLLIKSWAQQQLAELQNRSHDCSTCSHCGDERMPRTRDLYLPTRLLVVKEAVILKLRKQ